MNELMREEILDQPTALAQCLPSLRNQVAKILTGTGSPQRVIITGSGDSYFGPLALQFAAERELSIPVHVLPALTAARYWRFEPGDLLLAISVSGEAARTIEAARTAQQAGAFVMTVSANPDSTLAKIAPASVILEFKSRSRKTPHTTDYSTTLLALAVSVEVLGNCSFPVLDGLSRLVAGCIGQLEQTCLEIGQELADRERFYILGGGPNYATAFYAAAKFWEAGGLMAFHSDLEEFAHGPHLMVECGDPVLLVAPEGRAVSRAVEIIDGLQEIGAEILAITNNPSVLPRVRSLLVPQLAEQWSPFVTCLPLQWLCWSISTAKGYDVILKNGRRVNPSVHDDVHMRWVRSSSH